jgi:hypothetical protein
MYICTYVYMNIYIAIQCVVKVNMNIYIYMAMEGLDFRYKSYERYIYNAIVISIAIKYVFVWVYI